MLNIHTAKISEQTAGFCDIIDVTPKLRAELEKTSIQKGLLTAFITGSTAALTTIEFEPGLIQDLKEFVERWIPSDCRYHHDDRCGDDNGFSHLRASLFGPSLTVPIENGQLCLGTWQQVILLDFDNRPRSREIVVQLMGERE